MVVCERKEGDEAKGDIVGMTIPKSQFSEWFTEIIKKAELADLRYNVKGFFVNMPWSVLSMKHMYRLYENELEKKGHDPVWFPALIPESNFTKEAEHIEGFAPELFWVTHSGRTKLTEKLALRPTSETAMYNMYSLWIRSWRDLPLKLYQSAQVWRCDTKATRPFIRGREFHWIETHDVFKDEAGARNQVKEDMQTTENVMHKEFGIPFLHVRRPQWDKFPGAVHTYAADTVMPDGKVLQQPSTHFLGQNFAKSFNIKFRDIDESEKLVWQTCYGPCIWRMFSSVIALHGDDKGLIFPWNIAPVQVIIIPVRPESAVIKKCEEIRDKLAQKSIRARVDICNNTPGWKFNQWEMKGVPIRIEVGPREIKEKKLTIVLRDTGDKKTIPENDMVSVINDAGTALTYRLIKKADKEFKSRIHDAGNMDELKQKLDIGGLVRVDFCSDDEQGEHCAENIKERLHAQVRGERADKKEIPKGKCIVCQRKANIVVYVAKQY